MINSMNSAEVDAKLDDIALKQSVWKNYKLLTACLLIAEAAVNKGQFWPDALVFDFLLEDDRNVIGSAWRMCSKTLAIIEKTGQFRRSTAKDTNGRMIFEYRVTNTALAMAFLKRYDKTKYEKLCHPQLDLFK